MTDMRRIADRERLDGLLVCECPNPVLDPIPLFATAQCRRCWKPTLESLSHPTTTLEEPCPPPTASSMKHRKNSMRSTTASPN